MKDCLLLGEERIQDIGRALAYGFPLFLVGRVWCWVGLLAICTFALEREIYIYVGVCHYKVSNKLFWTGHSVPRTMTVICTQSTRKSLASTRDLT